MDSKKKKLIIILSVVGVIVLAAVIAIAVIFTREPEKPASEGSIYITASVDNGMQGQTYISFDYVPEPAEPAEDGYYGNVFHMYCSWVGSEYQDWMTGYWELDGDTLTLTGFWQEGASTYLADAESGVAKTYTAEDGKFYIDAEIGGTGVVTIVFDPAADKVGEVTDDDGNEDDADDENETPTAPEVLVSMTATDATSYTEAGIELYNDQTFAFLIGGKKVFGGTWVSTDTTGQNPMAPLTLTVDDTGKGVIGETVTVAIAPTAPDDYTAFTYSCHVNYVVPDTITMSFDFTGELDLGPTVASTLTATATGGQSAKIELMSDNTWVLSVSYYQGGDYTATASGTYALDAAYNMVLTVTGDTADALAEDSYTLACDYSTQTYSGTIECTLPVVGELSFAFTQQPTQA